MIPASFEYLSARTLRRAVEALAADPGARILAGGQSLLPAMKLRLSRPTVLVDISRVASLRRIIIETSGAIRIGALATHQSILESKPLRRRLPLLPETAAEIGDVQIRNMGTLGGSLAHADPAADWPAALIASEAAFTVEGPSGIREIPAADFFTGMFATELRPGEILTHVHAPPLPPRSGSAYRKMRQSASGFALVGAAAMLTLDHRNVIVKAVVALTGAADRPFRARRVEEALTGRPAEPAAAAEAAPLAADSVKFLSDLHASADFRAHLVAVHARRAIEAAMFMAHRAPA